MTIKQFKNLRYRKIKDIRKEIKRFYFVHNNKVEILSDNALKEEKYEADIYVAIFRRVKDKLNSDERLRVSQINKEIKKRGIRLIK